MKHVKNGKQKIGIVFNTDPHDKPGEHWVSMFIDVRAKVIFFFDSTGDKPQRRIRTFMKMVKEQGDANGIPFKEYMNNVSHQRNDSECGVFAIFMIIHMLLGKMTVHDFLDKKKKLTDKYMQRFRRKFFNVDEKVPTPNVDF
jgi:Ulp1 family protease